MLSRFKMAGNGLSSSKATIRDNTPMPYKKVNRHPTRKREQYAYCVRRWDTRMTARRGNLDLNIQRAFLCYIGDGHDNVIVYEVLPALVNEHGSAILTIEFDEMLANRSRSLCIGRIRSESSSPKAKRHRLTLRPPRSSS